MMEELIKQMGFETLMKRNKKSIFEQRYLRAVGQQRMRPADSLPCFFNNNTVDEGWNARNSMSPVESPMQGNNWRPTHPDGGERPTFFCD
jgi:hypothetical protein